MRASAALLATAACAMFGGARATPAAETPPAALDVHAGADGGLTLWLVSAPVSAEMAALGEPPREAREGQPAPGGAPWRLHVSDTPYVDVSPALGSAHKGVVWFAARVQSAGGNRVLAVLSSLEMKFFVNGQLIHSKPYSALGMSEVSSCAFELAPGESELVIATEIRWGQCFFRLSYLDARSLKPDATDHWRLPFGPGRTPDPGAALVQAVHVSGPVLALEPGRSAEVRVELHGGWPLGVGPVTPSFRLPEGASLAGELPPRTPEQLVRQPWSALLTLGGPPRSVVALACELRAAGRLLGAREIRLFMPRAIYAEAKQLRPQLVQACARIGRRLPYVELALEKLDLCYEGLPALAGGGGESVGETLMALLDTARAGLAAESAGRDPCAGQVGYFERAYTSRIDDSAQPFLVLVPSAASQALAGKEEGKRFPLVIFLHGYVPDYHKHQWWQPFDSFNQIFEKLGAFLAIPFGRSNTDFLGPGEVDVLDVLAEMKRLYPIDERRVYLYGYSMGGMGVYSLAGHYPDLFRAGVVLAGRAYSPLLMATAGFDALHPFKQFLIRADQPLDMCGNLLNFPVRIFHGSHDQFVPASEAEVMQKRLLELGGRAELRIVAGDHYSLFDVMADEDHVKWLLAQEPPSPLTRTERRREFSPRFTTFSRDVISDVRVSGELAPLELALERSMARDEMRLTVTAAGGALRAFKVNGLVFTDSPALQGFQRADSVFFRPGWGPEDEQRSVVPWKTSIRCGPVKEALCAPFALVYGTAAGPATAARLKEQAQAFAQDWYDFAKGRAIVKADTETTEQDRKTRNLFLFGAEQENAVHADAARTGKLPFRVRDGRVLIGTESVPLNERGVLYIYPSPLKDAGPSCSLVIASGAAYGRFLPSNHKLDLVPDFLVFADQQDMDGTHTNKPVVAGFFDGQWKYSAATTWWFEDARR